MKCFICKQEISSKDNRHIYFCAKVNNVKISRKEIRYKQICFWVDFDFTKEYLENKYLVEQWSLPDFKDNHQLSYTQTQFLLDYFLIEKRGVGVASILSSRLDKYKNTCIKRYGVENVSQLKDIKELKRQTFLANWGVDNIFKDKKFKENLNLVMMDKYGKLRITNSEKIKEYYKNLSDEERHELSMLNSKKSHKFWDNVSKEKFKTWRDKKSKSAVKYWKNVSQEVKDEVGRRFSRSLKKWWNSLSDEEKNKIIINNIKRLSNNFVSKLEKRVNDILYDWRITYVSQFQLGYYSFDFLIGKKILIEVQGDFWHANPLIYKKEDIMPFPGKSKTVKQIWAKDDNKKKYVEKRGYKIIYIWEKDMKKMNKEQLNLFLKEQIESLKYEN